MYGERIKTYLSENGISQTFLSEKTGIPIVILNTTLNGKRKMLATEYASICKALGLSLDFFVPCKSA